MMARRILVVCACLVIFAGLKGSDCAELEVDEHTLFLAHYNGNTANNGLDADYAKGKPTGKGKGISINRKTGKFKGGLIGFTDTGKDVRYSVSKNISLKEGTFECWFKPEWSSSRNDKKYRVLFQIGSGWVSNTPNIMALYFVKNRIYWRISDKNKVSHICGGTFGFEKGKWYQIAISWSNLNPVSGNSILELYVNGTGISRIDSAQIFVEIPATEFTIGNFGGRKYNYSVDASIDEVRISDIARYKKPILESDSLIKNSGFEDGLCSWDVSRKYTKGGYILIDDENAYKGDKCLKMEGKEKDANLNLFASLSKLEPGKKYRLSLYYRTTSLKKGYPKLILKVGFRDKDNKDMPRGCFHPKTPQQKYALFSTEFLVPLEAATNYMWIVAEGKGTVWFDEVKIIPVEEEKKIVRLSSLAYCLSLKPEAVIWYENPSTSVFPKTATRLLEKLDKRKEIRIYAAKGEYEPFQVVVSSLKDLNEVKIGFTDLKGSEYVLSKENISYNPVGYVNVRKVAINSAVLGLNPDPLLPQNEIDIPAGKTQPFWITVKVPSHINHGVYKGMINIIAGDNLLSKVPLKLVVWDFALPERNPLKTIFWFTERWASHFDKRPRQEIINNFLENLEEHRIAGNSAIIKKDWPKCEIKDGHLKITDFTAFDNYFKLIEKYGFNTRFPIPGIGRPDLCAFTCVPATSSTQPRTSSGLIPG